MTKTGQAYSACMSARGYNSIYFSHADKACGTKSKLKGIYSLAKKPSPFNLSIEFENKCAWNIENGHVCFGLRKIKR